MMNSGWLKGSGANCSSASWWSWRKSGRRTLYNNRWGGKECATCYRRACVCICVCACVYVHKWNQRGNLTLSSMPPFLPFSSPSLLHLCPSFLSTSSSVLSHCPTHPFPSLPLQSHLFGSSARSTSLVPTKGMMTTFCSPGRPATTCQARHSNATGDHSATHGVRVW